MISAEQRPDTGAEQSPKNQTGEDQGAIKRPQRTDQNTQVKDTSRGSEVETRNASNNRT